MLIRPELPEDMDAIRSLTSRAFAGHPYSDGAEPRIVDELRNAGALSISLVAEEEQHIVGHVAVSPVTIADGSTRWFGLGPISVEPGQQKQGIGSALMRAAIAVLEAEGACGCVVLGDPGYYARFGFAATAGLIFPGPPAEYFMALPFAARCPRGIVQYHPAFGGDA